METGDRPFGMLLRTARLAAGMTQEDLAARSGLSARAISDLERNRNRRPYFRSVRLLAEALGVPDPVRDQLLEAARVARQAGDAYGGGNGAGPADPGGFALGQVTPRQLPPRARHFTGRTAELASLADASARTDSTPAVLLIDGAAGVGKTALAVQWAHHVADRFSDGQLFVDLMGFDARQPPLAASQALPRLLYGLGVPGAQIPADAGDQVALYRTVVTGRRLLIVLDNAATADQVRPLIPGSPDCCIVVTSRNRLGGLVARDGAYRITLDVLAERESAALLSRTLGAGRIAAEPGAAADLTRICGHLPLAVCIAAERAAARPHLVLATLVEQLASEHERLDLLACPADETTAVRAAFSWSYNSLPAPVARTFRLLGLYPGAHISTHAAAALTGISAAQAHQSLQALANGHLLTETAPGRYQLHDLLRLYAWERARAEETAADRDDATGRLLGWYLHTADAADRAIVPTQYRQFPAPPPVAPPLTFRDRRDAFAWCAEECVNFTGVARQAAEAGRHRSAWMLSWALSRFFHIRKPWSEWIETTRIGVTAAQDGNDPLGEALNLISLGSAYAESGRLDDGVSQHLQALIAWTRAEDRSGEGMTLTHLGNAYRQLHRYADALDCLQRAAAIRRENRDPSGEGLALTYLADTYRELRRPAEALRCHQQVLAIYDQLSDNPWYRAIALASLADTYRELGRLGEAVAIYNQALAFRRETSDRWGEAQSLQDLGHTFNDNHQTDLAQQALRQAQKIIDDLDPPQITVERWAPRG